MKYEVRKVDPVSAARMMVVVGLAVGLVVGFLLLVAIWFFGGISGWAAGSAGKVIASLALGVVSLVGAPILFAVIGLICGYLGSGVYNFFANWYGGIFVEMEEREDF